jgi:hypothetical protein
MRTSARRRLMLGSLAALALVTIGVALGVSLRSDPAERRQDVVVGEVNSADRMVFWTRCDDVAALTDAELDEWKSRGVDGFVCMVGYLHGLGGANRFTGVARASLAGPTFALQRRLRDADLAARAGRRRMKLYLGFYASNYFNSVTPFADWFDERRWSRAVLPRVKELASAARRLGFAGLAVDQELYSDKRASWDWDYRNHGHSESRVRAKVRERGAQLMKAMVRGFPGLELMAYYTKIPGSWEERVQERGNHIPNAFRDNVQIDLWDGLSSVRGYRAIRLMDAIFYKTQQLPDASWDAALQYNANAVYSTLSRRFSNWAYASSRLHLSPFSWISSGQTDWEQARAPGHVAEQLDAFRKWGIGREFANYAYNGLKVFDYSPYVSAMRTASTPGQVDSTPPGLSITRRSREADGRQVTLRGFATDNFAVRSVRWRVRSGRSGVMRLRWVVDSGDAASGWDSRSLWTARGIPLSARTTAIEVTAEDIKGLTTVRKVRIRR